MLILKSKLIFLENPKCGSSTLRHYFKQIPDSDRIFKSMEKINECSGIHDPNYIHCTLKAAIIKLRELALDPDEFTFICAIREPYTRVKSALNYHRVLVNRRMQTDEFIKTRIVTTIAKDYRFFEKYKIHHLIKCETINSDLAELNIQYKLGLTINLSTKINSKGFAKPIQLANEHIAMINHAYHEDFIDGDYKKIIPDDLPRKVKSRISNVNIFRWMATPLDKKQDKGT